MSIRCAQIFERVRSKWDSQRFPQSSKVVVHARFTVERDSRWYYSASGRYVCSCSDYGERAIKLWDADMPPTKSTRHVNSTHYAALESLENLESPPVRRLIEKEGAADARLRV